ncbi:hypothetical protein HZF05_14800 [Sphingomonas sp. CGMCC 1.13654]|uniref:DUF937 domain-containing protein n=1 Tax=Sphingomonas chungangi TaxID=2683589 RepID=A0A838L791_9SPHN|nr:hypothetical protein [Sphingomonas chungangi]MBA2935353.1 hypothetical protein [Sphingomonas chungangi]
MGMLDGLLGQIGSNVDIENLATKIGLPADKVEEAVHALGVAHPQEGDTAEIAAQQTGLPTDTLNQIIGHIGGEGSLAEFSNILHSDAGSGIMGKLGGLFGGN